MDMLKQLHNRVSTPANLLVEPAPDDGQIEQIVQAGLTAPDHAKLQPWKFIVIRNEKRKALGDVFFAATARREPDMADEKLQKQKSKPLRSPLIIAVVASITPDHPKAPEVEQILSAGAALQLMQLAATAMGFGSIWLTGPNASDPIVKSALGIAEHDELVGFLYLGTPSKEKEAPQRARVADHLEYWQGTS